MPKPKPKPTRKKMPGKLLAERTGLSLTQCYRLLARADCPKKHEDIITWALGEKSPKESDEGVVDASAGMTLREQKTVAEIAKIKLQTSEMKQRIIEAAWDEFFTTSEQIFLSLADVQLRCKLDSDQTKIYAEILSGIREKLTASKNERVKK